MRIVVVGDTHGNPNDILPKIYAAGNARIQHVVVVGDFGLWTHKFDGQVFLDEVQDAARINNLSVYAIGGNHENWDHWNWIVANFAGAKGFAAARSRVLLAPKAHRWSWAGKEFIGAGGAVSVDKSYRLMAEKGEIMGVRGSGPRTLYWDNEELADSDVDTIKTFGKADYLFSHDCSNYTPFKGRLKPDLNSQIHRQRIDEVLKSVQPKMHFHGHMHDQYDWFNNYSGQNQETGEGARTIGLQAFTDRNSYGVLEVESGTWWWPDEFAQAEQDRKDRKAAHDRERYEKSGIQE